MQYSYWQEDSGVLSVVLQEVFAWLSARELAASGAVSRAWRAAARLPPLWRRLLRRAGLADATLRALRDHHPSISWRQEYVNICAGWNLVDRIPKAGTAADSDDTREPARRSGGAQLVHAALDAAGTRLALAADDGTFSIWERISGNGWREEWSTDLRARAWAGAVRAQWAAARARLLLAGALALADRWELLVLQRDEWGEYRCTARAGCSAGAGGCWAGPDAFLSLQLTRVAPRLALTVVWLNAATQETHSEYAGVTAPLLRVFNEDSAHLTHVLIADLPLEAVKDFTTEDNIESSLGPSYYNATDMDSKCIVEERVQMMVTASHGASGGMRAWSTRARRPPPLRAAAAGSLRERARRAAAPSAPPAPPAADPDEETVRAMCDPPDAECYLHAAILGIVLHPNQRCVWASTADGRAWCVSLPALARLCALRGAGAPGDGDPYYVQPAAARRYVATPAAPARRARLRLWSALSGAPCPRPPHPPHHATPLVCLLPPCEDEMLVLAGHSVYMWRSRATPQPD